jgi:periplasmic divalent cation tolerance protein
MTDIILVVTTFEEKEEAQGLGSYLLKKRLIGCAQIMGPVDSQYWWQGKLESAKEYRLEMKSSQGLWKKLEKEILKKHSYQTPEIIATTVSAVSKDYEKWLLEELQQ